MAETLEFAGLEVALARGEGDYRQMEPAPGLIVVFGGCLTEEVAYDAGHRSARDALVAGSLTP